jgi:hypothetical protein
MLREVFENFKVLEKKSISPLAHPFEHLVGRGGFKRENQNCCEIVSNKTSLADSF